MAENIHEYLREKKMSENFKKDEIFFVLFNECKNPKTFQLEQFVLANYEDVNDYNSTIEHIENLNREILKLTKEKNELEKFLKGIKDGLAQKYNLDFLKEMAHKSRDFDYLNLSNIEKIKYLQELINK